MQLAAQCNSDNGSQKVYWITYDPSATELGIGWEEFDNLEAVKARWPDAAEYVDCTAVETMTWPKSGEI